MHQTATGLRFFASAQPSSFGDHEVTLRSSSQAATCLPLGWKTTLSLCNAELQAGKL